MRNRCCQDCLDESSSYTISLCNNRQNNWQRFICTMPNYDRNMGSTTTGCTITTNTNQGVPWPMCTNCPVGFYRDKSLASNCYCRPCRTGSCPAGEFLGGTCTHETNRVCTPCNSCPTGQEVLTPCTTTSDVTCKDCERGVTFRSSIQQATCQPCRTCDPKQRQRRAGCTPTADETCPTCNPGFIVTAAQACQQCTGETYALDVEERCATCTTCTRTQRQERACSSTSNRECRPCDPNERTLATNADKCDGCVDGYFRFGIPARCAQCAGADEPLWCATYQYRRCYTEDGMGLRQCLFCDGQNHASSTKCTAGKGVSEMCRGSQTSRIQCQDCEAGTHRPAETPFFEGTHQRCVACSLGTFKAAKGTANCVSCTVKPANSQFSEWEAGNKRMEDKCPW
jgi:hypothetical protein